MKTYSLKLRLLVVAISVSLVAGAQTQNTFSNGLQFDNPSLKSGSALQVGAKYLFSNVKNNVDAVVSIDSLVNGAQVTKIDDNSNGTGYKEAFQPAVQSGGVIGYSYAVFSFKFYQHSSNTPVAIPFVAATALDIDGNATLKEFVRIDEGSGSTMSYLVSTPDIAVSLLGISEFSGLNILGIERAGIDTSALTNMFTTSNTNVSSFTVRFGTVTLSPTNTIRQFSMYMDQFSYNSTTLPVKLASFTATLNSANKAKLDWTTTSEINVSHFVVERSTNGTDFTDAAIVFANGGMSDKTDYTYTDDLGHITATIVYYRLRSVDNDGKVQYSETRIIRISNKKESELKILAYPNPVVNELRVTLPANWQNKQVIYEVFQVSGQLVQRTQTANSSQTESLRFSSYAPGIYIVKVSCEGMSTQQRIVKQ